MPKGQRVRQLGKNMKPRETEEIAAEVENEPSTDEGPEGSEEIADSDGLSEVEDVGGQSEETSQNGLLQENAVSSQFPEAPKVPDEAFETLAALMKSSEEASGAPAGPATPQVVRNVGNETVYVGVEDGDIRKYGGIETTRLLTHEEVEAVKRHFAETTLQPPSEMYVGVNVRESQLADLGELSTGEYRTTVRIPEGYIAGIEDQAKADNMTLEDWVSMRFGDYLTQWFFSPGSK